MSFETECVKIYTVFSFYILQYFEVDFGAYFLVKKSQLNHLPVMRSHRREAPRDQLTALDTVFLGHFVGNT